MQSIKLPKKVTKVELEIFGIIVNKFISKFNCPVYQYVDDGIDKMIIYYLFDQGYSLTETCTLMARKRKFIWERKKHIIKVLREHYPEFNTLETINVLNS
jgi:hypothetical protein